MIKAIIFDADGVVIDTEPIYSRADRAFLKSCGVGDNYDDFMHLLTGVSLENGTKLMQKMLKINGDPTAIFNKRLNMIKTFYNKVNFVPGFLDFFNNKIKPNYKSAVATSSNVELFNIADTELGLRKLFGNHIYFLKDVGHVSKPSPDIFLHAAKMLKTPPTEGLVIEDAVNGITAAKAAGMKCVGLATTHDKIMLKAADQVVNSFSEIDLSKF
jgi:beta-phosphoglucomutase